MVLLEGMKRKNSGITLKFGIEIEVPAYPFEKRKNTCNNRGSATHTTSDFYKNYLYVKNVNEEYLE